MSEKSTIRRKLWALSYPTMIALGFQTVNDLVDMAWLGQLSSKTVGAATLFFTIYALMTVTNEIVGTSSVSMLSQSYGRNDIERYIRISEQSIVLKFLMGLLTLGIFAVVFRPLLGLYTSDPEVIRTSIDYASYRAVFMPLAFASYTVNTVFRCMGDSKTPMRIMLVCGAFNLLINPFVIFKTVPFLGLPGLGWGVRGAALTTSMATNISLVLGLWILYSGKYKIRLTLKGLFRLEKEIVSKLLTIGLPTGMESLLKQGFNAILIKYIAGYSMMAVSLAGVSGRVNAVLTLPLMGLTLGGSTTVGHYLGKERTDLALLTSRLTTEFNLALTGLSAVFLCLFPRQIVSVFLSDPLALSEGEVMLRLLAPALILAGLMFGRSIVFHGSGLMTPLLISGTGSRWAVQLPLLVLAVNVFALPLWAVWWINIIMQASEFLIVLYFFKRGKWQRKRVV